MAPDRLLPLRIRASRGPRRGRAVDGEGGWYGPPAFAGLVSLAQTTVYDNRLVASVSTPNAAMLGVDVPTTILRGDPTLPLIVTAVDDSLRRDRSRGARPNRLIIAMRGAARAVIDGSSTDAVVN
jgi:hypothetical protein